MGRSVSFPRGACVAFCQFDEDFDDPDEADWAYEMLCEDITAQTRAAFASFDPAQGWRGREDRILLRNSYADVGVSIYGGIAAIWLVERDDGAYHDCDARTACRARAAHWLQQVAPRFIALFAQLDCIGRMSNGESVYAKRQAA